MFSRRVSRRLAWCVNSAHGAPERALSRTEVKERSGARRIANMPITFSMGSKRGREDHDGAQ